MAKITRANNITTIEIEAGKNLYVGMLVINDTAYGMVLAEAEDAQEFLDAVRTKFKNGKAHPFVDLATHLEFHEQGFMLLDMTEGDILQ